MTKTKEHAADDTPPKAPRAHWFRRWWTLILSIGILVSAMVIWTLDERAPDVSDIKFTPLVLKPEDNGFHLLAEAAFAAQKAVHPTSDSTNEDDDLLHAMRLDEMWDEARVAQWMTALEPVWPLLVKASKATDAQASQLKEISDLTPEAGPMQKLAAWAALKIKNDLRQNRPEDAVQTALASLRCSALLQKSRGGLLLYLTSIATKTVTLKSIEEIARDPRVTPDQLREIIALIQASRESGEGLRYALRSEIYMMESALRTTSQSGYTRRRSAPLTALPLFVASKMPGLYKPNKTLRIYVKNLRLALAVAGKGQAALAAYNATDPSADFREPSPANSNPDNFYGRKLLQMIDPRWGAVMRIQLVDQSRSSAYQAFIALHLYRRDHGQFPATLEALVPVYLPAVPNDHLDDAPIRYSAELGVVWSIGRNGLNVTSADQDTGREIALWLTPRKPKTALGSTSAPTPNRSPANTDPTDAVAPVADSAHSTPTTPPQMP